MEAEKGKLISTGVILDGYHSCRCNKCGVFVYIHRLDTEEEHEHECITEFNQ